MTKLPSHPLLNLSEKEIAVLLQCDASLASETLQRAESTAVNHLFKLGLVTYRVDDGKWVTTPNRGDLVALVFRHIAFAQSTKDPSTDPHKGAVIRADVETLLAELLPRVCALK